MDLNLQYFKHQLSMVQASETLSRLRPTLHLAAAGAAANWIRNFQLAAGERAAGTGRQAWKTVIISPSASGVVRHEFTRSSHSPRQTQCP